MVQSSSQASAIFDQDFERLFIDELNWDRFAGRLSVALAAPGQFSKGWLTREEKSSFVKLIEYPIRGVARLGGQVVLTVSFSDESSFPDYLRRCSIGRRVSRLHYEPIIIYTCPIENEQVWQFVALKNGDPEFFEHRIDCLDDAVSLAHKLKPLAFSLDDRAAGLPSIEVGRRVRQALSYRRKFRAYERGQLVPEMFDEFGCGLPELAELAQEYRGIERDVERTLFEMCRDGSESARWQLIQSHLYLPLKIGLRFYQRKQLEGTVDFPDVVSYGIMGLLRAVDRYRPEMSPRFVTYASLWVRRELDREVPKLAYPVELPYYVHQNLAPVIEVYDREVDRLAQRMNRLPPDDQMQRHLGLGDRDWRTLHLMLSPAVADEALIDVPEQPSFSANEVIATMIWMQELEGVLSRLTPSERETIRLRYGVDGHGSRTLDEVGTILGVSRERVRQLELKAHKKLRHIGQELSAQGCAFRAGPPAELLVGFLNHGPNVVYGFVPRDSSSPEVTVVNSAGRVVDVIPKAATSPSVHHLHIHPEPAAEEEFIPADECESALDELEVDPEPANHAKDPGPWPPAPGAIRKANSYVEHILDTYGPRYAPELLYHALRYYFPQSIITLDQVKDKFLRRGWSV